MVARKTKTAWRRTFSFLSTLGAEIPIAKCFYLVVTPAGWMLRSLGFDCLGVKRTHWLVELFASQRSSRRRVFLSGADVHGLVLYQEIKAMTIIRWVNRKSRQFFVYIDFVVRRRITVKRSKKVDANIYPLW